MAVLPSEWLRLCEHRLAAPKLLVKCPLRIFSDGNDQSKRSRARESAITYVAMEGLTEFEMEFCMNASATCEYSTVAEVSMASFLWVKGATLPEQLRGWGDLLEYDLEEACGWLDFTLLSASVVALQELLQHVAAGTKKARRLRRVIKDVSAAVEFSDRANASGSTGHSSSSAEPDLALVAEEPTVEG